MKHISEIFNLSYLMTYILKNILPLILVNYSVNVALNLLSVIIMSRKFYKASGLTMRFVFRCLTSTLLAIFPLNLSQQSANVSDHTTCKCSDDTFIDDLVTKIMEKERQRFLSNLQL